MNHVTPLMQTSGRHWRVMWLSSIAFTLMFCVWMMLGVLIVPIQRELNLTGPQKEWLLAAAILSGALLRLNAGLWADQFGGKIVTIVLLLVTAIPAYLVSQATTYGELLVCALFFGLAGNSFTVGISWNSAWFPQHQKGLALGVFGAGNVGAAGTKLLVIFVPAILTLVPSAGILGGLIPGGWRAIPAFYSLLLVAMAAVLWWGTPSPDRCPGRGRSLREMLVPLRQARVWRFSLYYVVVFGAYVALSAWLPMYFIDTYQVELHEAALYTAFFILPASLLRPLGGWMADQYGPRPVTYAVFIAMLALLCLLLFPADHALGLGVQSFAFVMFLIGCAMGVGKGSVFKYIPDYFPNDVGAVGGLVGMLGAMGGFILPPAFGLMARTTGAPQSAFLALIVMTGLSLAWLHTTVMRLRAAERTATRAAVVAVEN